MQTPPEVIVAVLVFMAFWLIITLVILIAGQYHPKVRGFRDRMRAHWKPALVIAGLYALGSGIGGREFLNPYALAVFCQALIGLTIASGIKGYQPLPVVNAFVQRKQVLRQLILMLVISVFVVIPALLIGEIGSSIGHLFGEANYTREAANTFPPNKWLAFFILLSGAGIADETPYRLVLIPLFWRVTERKWLASVLSALVFAAEHLTPLVGGRYRVFWQFPISQFLGSVFIGMFWGYLFIKRGYETTVLGHTMQDWLTLMIFAG